MSHQHCLVDLRFSEPARLVKICLHDHDNHYPDDCYDDPNYDYDDTDGEGVGHLLRGEKGLDSDLLSSPASQPNFAISEIIMMNKMNTMIIMNIMISNKYNDDYDQLVR